MVGVSRDLNENYVVSLCDLFNRALNEFKPMPVNGETMVSFCYTEPILGYFNNISNGIDSLVKNFPLGNEHKGEGIVGKIICDLYNDSEKLNLNGKWQEKVMERNDTYKEYAD